jgi:hypothetical protein
MPMKYSKPRSMREPRLPDKRPRRSCLPVYAKSLAAVDVSARQFMLIPPAAEKVGSACGKTSTVTP